MNRRAGIVIQFVMNDLWPVLGEVKFGIIVFVMATDAAVVPVEVITGAFHCSPERQIVWFRRVPGSWPMAVFALVPLELGSPFQ